MKTLLPPKAVLNCCFICGGNHPHHECDLIQPPRPPAPPTTTPPPEEPPGSSLPITRFEELFGEGAEGLLQDVIDQDPQLWTADQRELAFRILGGDRELRSLTSEERSILDEITGHLAGPRRTVERAPATIPRPAYIRTQAEMENFEEEYQPPPEKRDWPFSPDDPEGFQG
jgi:hypothetical protein